MRTFKTKTRQQLSGQGGSIPRPAVATQQMQVRHILRRMGRRVRLGGASLEQQAEKGETGSSRGSLSPDGKSAPVSMHADTAAAQLAAAFNARAFTVGGEIFFGAGQFAPYSAQGQRLLAHELAHVRQQAVAGASHLIQRKKRARAPAPFYQEVLDAIAAEEKTVVRLERSTFGGFALPFLRKVEALAKAVAGEDREAIGAGVDALVAQDPPNLAPYLLSDSLYRELIARVVLLDMPPGKANELRRWFLKRKEEETHYTPPGQEYAQEVYLAESVAERALAGLPAADADAALAAFDELLAALGWLRDERGGLDQAAVAKDRKSNAEIAEISRPFYISLRHTLSGYHDRLVVLLGEVFTGTQLAYQQILDRAIADLEQDKETKFLKAAAERLRRLSAIVESEKQQLRFPGLQVEVTRTEFGEKRARHLDIFLPEGKARRRSVGLKYYDQELGGAFAEEKQMPLDRILFLRRKQIELLETLYGSARDKSGALTAETKENRAAIEKALGGRMRLHSNDDWRKFLLAKFKAREKEVGRARALTDTIDLLKFYLLAFTTHSPLNIEEFGDNYLTRNFPRSLTGQLIHDCGVYALRIAYMLSLVRKELDLKFRFAVLPLHVGLIITGENLPVYIAHNNQFTILAPDEVARLRRRWQETDVQGGERKAAPVDEEQFLGEVAAQHFVPNVDMPFRLLEVAPPKGKPERIRDALWHFYRRKVVATELFSPAVQQPESPHYQFDLHYLRLLQLQKQWYNDHYVPFWNVHGHGAWQRHGAKIEKALVRLQGATGKEEEAAARRDYEKAIAPYRKTLEAAFQKVLDARGDLGVAEVEVSVYLDQHPEVLAKGVPVSPVERLDLGRWLTAWFWDHLADLDAGRAVRPPFAGKKDFIWPIE